MILTKIRPRAQRVASLGVGNNFYYWPAEKFWPAAATVRSEAEEAAARDLAARNGGANLIRGAINPSK